MCKSTNIIVPAQGEVVMGKDSKDPRAFSRYKHPSRSAVSPEERRKESVRA